MKNHVRTFSLFAIGALILAFGVVVVLLSQSSRAPSQPQAPPQSSPTTPTPPKATTTTIKVFFSKHPASDDDPTQTFPVDRVIDATADPIVASIGQLLVGPTAQEVSQGYFSTVRVRSDASNCGNSDFTITIKDTTATLRFCRTFDAIGTMSDGQAQETIKATLLQFPTIKKVIILTKDGNCQFDMSGENRCLL